VRPLGDSGGKFADGDARAEQNDSEHGREDEQRDIAGDEEFAERQQCGYAHAAHGVGEGRAGGDRRHDHDDPGEAEHGFSERLQHTEQRARFASGRVARAAPKSRAKTATWRI